RLNTSWSPVLPMFQVVEPTTPTGAPRKPDPSPTCHDAVLPLGIELGRGLRSCVPLSKFSAANVRVKPELFTIVMLLVIESIVRDSRASTRSRARPVRRSVFLTRWSALLDQERFSSRCEPLVEENMRRLPFGCGCHAGKRG